MVVLQPLIAAANVLKPESIAELKRGIFGRREWLVADRWATSSPLPLVELEAQGQIILLDAILRQAHRERSALALAPGDLMAMSESEYLLQAGIQLAL